MGARGFKIKRFFEDISENIKLFFEDLRDFYRMIRDHNVTFKIFRAISKTIKKLWFGLIDYIHSWGERHSSGSSFKIDE